MTLKRLTWPADPEGIAPGAHHAPAFFEYTNGAQS
jgi:hypothetical protein